MASSLITTYKVFNNNKCNNPSYIFIIYKVNKKHSRSNNIVTTYNINNKCSIG